MGRVAKIYKITNTVNNKVYIGYTSQTVQNRWLKHVSDSFSKQTKLARAIRKYGRDSFMLETLYESPWVYFTKDCMEALYININDSILQEGMDV